MKKKNFFALLAQAGLALAAALLISIGLASCSKDKNKTEEDVIYMTTAMNVGDNFEFVFNEDDEPIVEGAEKLESNYYGLFLDIKYKLKAQNIAVKGTVTRLECPSCNITYLNANGTKGLEVLSCRNNPALSKLELNNSKLREIFCYSCDNLSKLELNNSKQLKYLDCSACKNLSNLDLRNCPRLSNLRCEGTKISGNNLSLPSKMGKSAGLLYFKTGSDTEQKLSSTQVAKIKDELNWNILYSPTNNGNWEEYPGED